MSKVIFLNGCSSSGKTSIVKAITQESSDLWVSFGIDTFINMIPFYKQESYLKFISGKNEYGTTMHVETGVEGEKLFSVMPKFAEILADNGSNIIIDEVLFEEETLKSYIRHLKNHIVYYIGVFCDLRIMQEREILRQDRCIGLSNDQINIVHQGILNSYDFKVDTTAISPFEAARLILKFIDENPTPKAFQLKEEHKLLDENKILEELKSMEPIFHHPEKFGKKKQDIEAQMCDEFLEVGASGNVYTRQDVIDTLLARYQSTDYQDIWEAKDFALTKISQDNYLLTYILIQDKTRMTRRSTLWRAVNGNWQILYHQGTVIGKNN